MLSAFPQEQIGRGHLYIEYTEKVLIILLMSKLKKYFFVRVECKFIVFPGKYFLYVLQTKIAIASGTEKMCPCATPLGTYFPEGDLVYYMGDYFSLKGSYFLSTTMVSVSIFTLGGKS